MIAVQVVPDRFSVAERALVDTQKSFSSSQGGNHVRRMTRGIVLKEDTFATLRLVAGDGSNKVIIDAGSNRGPDPSDGAKYLHIGEKRATDVYSNFLLQQVQEERMEKQQIIETFGEAYIFLFGERARVISFSGILANTWDFNWEAEWWENYENYLRGTRCVENDARVFLSFDTTLVGGYIISSAATKVAQERNLVQFQFQLFVTSYTNFSDIGNPNANPEANSPFSELGTVPPAIANVFRPHLLTDQGAGNPPPGSPVGPNGIVGSPSLLDQAAQSLIDSVSNFWSSASQIVDNVISTASQLLNGDLVRVPVGFAGSLAFDDGSNIKFKEIAIGGPIRFTTFADNTDEYVGSSDHYGSSDPALFQSRIQDFGDSVNQLEFGQKVVDEATKTWAAAGLSPPGPALGPVSSFLARAGIGLLGVGASAAWQATASPGGLRSPDGTLPLGIGQEQAASVSTVQPLPTLPE